MNQCIQGKGLPSFCVINQLLLMLWNLVKTADTSVEIVDRITDEFVTIITDDCERDMEQLKVEWLSRLTTEIQVSTVD